MVDGRIGGPLPRVLGHEIAGRLAGIGDVLVYPGWSDGTCEYCLRGLEQLCTAVAEPGWAVDGGFAERLLVPHPRFLFPLGGLDPVRAAPLADAGVTAYRAVRRLLPWLVDRASVLVIGAGGVGQFVLQYLRLFANPRIAVLEPRERQRRRALESGADQAGAPDEPVPKADVVLDLVGTDATLSKALDRLRPTGALAILGEGGGRIRLGFDSIPPEAHIFSSLWGTIEDLRAVLDLAQRGEIDWNVETAPLSEVNEALDRVRSGAVDGRIVLVP
ncbi:zinc-binding dehydrogenase [Sciscionella sediminilitoris]|uniref:zinc-binding dehydrogenase n=1 Tax=Sciscionella sediminilitoris TaxID=1445613 RepID=UPI0009EA8300|nr:alcohol dehydrogenase catalytic domain-containing protein [Sciscionella sp. SE31]